MIYFVFFLLGMLVLGMVIAVAMGIIKNAKKKQATMPSANVKRRLCDLEVGATAIVSSSCCSVDEKRRCWINVQEAIGEPGFYSGNGRLQVTRTETGYEAKLLTPSTKFKCGYVFSDEPLEKLEIAS